MAPPPRAPAVLNTGNGVFSTAAAVVTPGDDNFPVVTDNAAAAAARSVASFNDGTSPLIAAASRCHVAFAVVFAVAGTPCDVACAAASDAGETACTDCTMQ